MNVELINIDILKPFEKNPKQHPKEQSEKTNSVTDKMTNIFFKEVL